MYIYVNMYTYVNTCIHIMWSAEEPLAGEAPGIYMCLCVYWKLYLYMYVVIFYFITYVYMYVCMYVCIYKDVFIYIYVFICIC
jgi:hypothetical protein